MINIVLILLIKSCVKIIITTGVKEIDGWINKTKFHPLLIDICSDRNLNPVLVELVSYLYLFTTSN